MVWNEDTIRQLRELWAEGHSTAEIGRRLGVSKNAIVGKAHRLDLDARPSPIRRESGKSETDRPPSYPRPAGPTLPPLASASVPPPVVKLDPAPALRPVVAPTPVARVPVLNPPPAREDAPSMRAVTSPSFRRSAPTCCWPIGEPGTRDFRFCDDASLPGKPYCDEHAKLAYVRIKDRKEDAA
ncbi:MAG TPA: GcrA family cell cycle regulator [Rhodopila sp.]|uniref:GcrA family cell cycle regulator n=1 Tax=Rhodopila sp. TaxID=2480087 RepID=UPI002B61FC51|nr:GcrA family cell cycle regulator [Rhodopila sp.]HVY16810.1 GcrA family cell cycle regulator [Rhodopila sp.]